MQENKTIVDEVGNIVEKCVAFIDGTPLFFTMFDNYIALDCYTGNFVKPLYDFSTSTWVESATVEETQEYNELNSEVEITTEEKIEQIEENINNLQIMYYDMLLEI